MATSPSPPSVMHSASSPMSRRNYGVFLSFRGPDCRNTIVSHLYNALCQKGVNVFKDNEELEAGQRRSELFEAIEGSRIAIVMFSENYARSRWCLDELKKIMDCRDQGKLDVLPIFYQVSPGEVRLHEKPNGEKGCYQAAIEEMEARYGMDSELVKGWKKALWQGGDMIGIPLSLGQDEGSVVQEVVRKVSKILNRLPLEVAKYMVGIDRKIEAVRPLLHLDPHESNVYMKGIVGEGGMGKTTISKAICNDIADMFDDWCFLRNVRESSRDVRGLALLQQELLRKLLNDEQLTVGSVDAGIPMIKERLRNKRVLIILDDVDELAQFDALAGSRSWFGKGSRIIITTRNVHVLPSDRVQHVHRVSLLEKAEADSLFRLHAFGESQVNEKISQELIERCVAYASQLPLALVVLGAFLRDRTPSAWEKKLDDLKKSPDTEINSVLRISFNGLEDKHKEIFLDVACFFNRWSKHQVEKILDSCDFVTSLGIDILTERCLVTVDGGTIQMHDLLVEMGKSIVKESYLPSRIWQYKDFLDIMSKNTVGSKISSLSIDMLNYSWVETLENFRPAPEKLAVKGIVLNLAEKELSPVQPNTLIGFKNLRIFIARNVDGPKKPLRMPSELRWLEWQGYSASAIEFHPSSNKIVGLDMENSRITKIKGQGFKELKYVKLLRCYFLSTLPDLSMSSKLEELNLGGCSNLTTIDEAVGSSENLVHLYAGDCSRLAKVPRLLRSKRLQTLSLWGCSKLNELPRFMEHALLKELHLSGSGLIALPESISNLVALEILYMSGCDQFSIIPSSIYKLQSLRDLVFQKCLKLERFPRRLARSAADILGLPNLVTLFFSDCRLKDVEFLADLACFETLDKLDLSANVFARIPGCLSKFKNLKTLLLCDCSSLVEVPEFHSHLVSHVETTRCFNLRSFPRLHTFICRFPISYMVDLSECSLGGNFIIASLPLEMVREFIGEAGVICSPNEFPPWVNFQSTESGSRYIVSLPRSMSADDILGLALFVTVESGCIPFDDLLGGCLVYPWANVVVGSRNLSIKLSSWEAVHTWFVYIPHVPIQGNEPYAKPNQHITLEFPGKEEVKFLKWGVRILCKQEQDDHRIRVRKIESGKSDSSGSEHETYNERLR